MSERSTLISAILGLAAALLLFFGTYGLQPYAGGVFNSEQVEAWNARVRTNNKRRTAAQRLGLVLLIASFAVQIVGVLWSGLI